MRLELAELPLAASFRVGDAYLLPVLPAHGGLVCPLRTLTGIPCPLCGMTTSVVATSRGRLGEAWAATPAGIAVFAMALALLVLRTKPIALPRGVVPLALTGMWVFQLHRFSII